MRIVRSQPETNKNKVYQRDLVLAVLQGGAGFILLSLLAFGFVPNDGPGFWVIVIIGAGLIGGGIWFGLVVVNYNRRQRLGERVCEVLTKNLGDDYIYFRNLNLPGQRSVGQIDGVLLGPSGAVVLEIENYTGEYAVEGDTWYRYGRGKSTKPTPKPLSQMHSGPAQIEPRRRLDDSPTWTAIRAAREVKAWLSVRGLPQVVVQGLVVLGTGRLRSIKRPSAEVVEFVSLENYLKEHLLLGKPTLESEKLPLTVVEQIAQRLTTNAE